MEEWQKKKKKGKEICFSKTELSVCDTSQKIGSEGGNS